METAILKPDDYAMLRIAIDQQAGTPNNDGRYYFDEPFLDNVQIDLTGAFEISLPVRVSLLGAGITLGEPLSIKSNPVYSDQGLTQLLLHLINDPAKGAESPILFTYPDIVAAFNQFGDGFSALSILNNPGLILDGVDVTLLVIQEVFGSSLAQDIPLIGDKLGAASEVIRDFRQGLLAELREKLSGNGKAIEVIRQALFDVIGPDGIGILLDGNADAEVTLEDIQVRWFDVDGNEIKDWQVGDEIPENADAIQFDLKMGGVIWGGGFDIPLDIDVPFFQSRCGWWLCR